MMEMINTLNANSKVGGLEIRLDSDNRWNDRIVRMMMDRYTNIYWIIVYDDND